MNYVDFFSPPLVGFSGLGVRERGNCDFNQRLRVRCEKTEMFCLNCICSLLLILIYKYFDIFVTYNSYCFSLCIEKVYHRGVEGRRRRARANFGGGTPRLRSFAPKPIEIVVSISITHTILFIKSVYFSCCQHVSHYIDFV